MRSTNLRTSFLSVASMVSALTLAFVLVAPAAADTGTSWSLDPAHTEINFSVKHFFTPVTGSFGEFDVELRYDAENPERSRVEVRIPVASIDTGNAMRDKHLRSADWFEADDHAYITFISHSVQKKGRDKLIARGPLTIKGISHDIELQIKLLGRQPIPEPMREMMNGALEVASFQASLTLDRADFGVGVGSWAATMVVGGEVTIEILAEAHRR